MAVPRSLPALSIPNRNHPKFGARGEAAIGGPHNKCTCFGCLLAMPNRCMVHAQNTKHNTHSVHHKHRILISEGFSGISAQGSAALTFDVAVQEAVAVRVPQPEQDFRGILAHQRRREAPQVVDEAAQKAGVGEWCCGGGKCLESAGVIASDSSSFQKSLSRSKNVPGKWLFLACARANTQPVGCYFNMK